MQLAMILVVVFSSMNSGGWKKDTLGIEGAV